MNARFLLHGMILTAAAGLTVHAQGPEMLVFAGAVDGSAAVPAGAGYFIGATDEDNTLRVYRREVGGLPLQSVDLSSFLAVNPASPETDIEGAALIGNRAYWITGHARDKRGREQSSRQRLFATDWVTNQGGIQISGAGRPYTNLLADLASSEPLRTFDLGGASRRLPEEPGGLNIEGLASTPDGRLLIGFRNPIPGGRALIVPLLNPDGIMAGQRAELGPPVLLDLGGRGIRDMTMWRGEYLIIAGSYDARGASKLFRWSGGDAKPQAVSHPSLKPLNPEAIVVYPDKGLQEFQLLSDDSSTQDEFPPAPKGPQRERFRGIWVTPK